MGAGSVFTQGPLGWYHRYAQGGLAPPLGFHLGSSSVGLPRPLHMVPKRKFLLLLLCPHPQASGIWNMQARFGGPTSRSSGLPHRSGSTLHLQLLTLSTLSVLGPLTAVAVEHLLST